MLSAEIKPWQTLRLGQNFERFYKFIAVPSGIGVFRALTATLFPGIYQPGGGQALYVFELPPQR